MPARTTYRIVATVQDEYEDEPRVLLDSKDYLAPAQAEHSVMANCLRSSALLLGPEDGDERSNTAIYTALDRQRGKLLQEREFPETAMTKLALLWELADDLGLDWYGVR